MNIAIRVDASTAIGTGHLRRCLSLAQALAEQGAEVVLVVRRLDGVAGHVLEGCGFPVHWLPAPTAGDVPDADGPPHRDWAQVSWRCDAEQTVAVLGEPPPQWLVVDHYSLDARWHRAVTTALSVPIAAIDDLADRELDADLLVDHNLAPEHNRKYAATGSRIGRLLGGPRYALLAPSYRDAPRYAFSDVVRSVGIFVGGTDPWNVSALALVALREHAGFHGPVEIATTGANPHLATLRADCEVDGAATLLTDQPSLHAFYARHDLQIGAGGGAAWERCCIGVPTLLLTLADNQRTVAEGLKAAGAVRLVSGPGAVALGWAFAELRADAPSRQRMVLAGRALVDGQGARRVALALGAGQLTLRRASMIDAEPCHVWRNADDTRRYFRDPTPVALADHLQWWRAALESGQRHLLVAQVGNESVGVVRLDIESGQAVVSIYTDPALVGLGLGRRMLDATARWAGSLAIGLRGLVAEIDPRNAASAAAFAASGFRQITPRRWSRSLLA